MFDMIEDIYSDHDYLLTRYLSYCDYDYFVSTSIIRLGILKIVLRSGGNPPQ